MRNRKHFLILLFCILVAAFVFYTRSGIIGFRKNASSTVELNSNWEFFFNGQWLDATVPGCIHTDLMHNKLIADPFFACNEDSVAWVADREWTYKTRFDKSVLGNYTNTNLVFEGLDTYAEIYLNGSLLSTAGNMFRKWEIPIMISALKEKDNELIVKFIPSTRIDSLKAAKLNYTLPETRAFTRKAPYQNGWDWGPKLITCGIWQPVYFKQWSGITISDFQVAQDELSDTAALFDAKLRILSDTDYDAIIECRVNGKIVNTVQNIHLQKGINGVSFRNVLENPSLWWPNGLGEQHLYNISAKIKVNKFKDKAERTIGFRTIELKRDKDQYGSEFTFVVNGIPMFAKGVNYIPPESFITSMTTDKYRELLTSCKDANMNMIRVWGGGQYENEDFYRFCDEFGLLVWQDFIFSCALYPADSGMAQNIKDEVSYQICRLRNHASLAVWCGNNEVKNGWEDWGWQDLYTDGQRDSIYADYENIFHTIIPKAIELYDGGRPYVASSPEWGWGHPECITHGDSHYWGVWWGEEPFEVWGEKTGRFMSEYGFQAYPQMSTIESFSDENERFIGSDAMNNHQKNARGTQIVQDAMAKYYGVPEKFDDYIYVSQLVQAYGIGNALETHRMKMPYCMGTLYWQLNDCWPVVSWSSIDYYGNWKALHYTTADKFEPFILATEMHNDSIHIYLVSDYLKDTVGTLYIDVMNFNGDTLRHDMIMNLKAVANNSSLVCIYPVRDDFMAQKDEIFINLSFVNNDDQLIGNKYFFLDYPVNLQLPEGQVDIEVVTNNERCTISFKSEVFVKDLFIYTNPYVKGKYSDNFFDMIPGEKKVIEFYPHDIKQLQDIQFKVKTYNNVF